MKAGILRPNPVLFILRFADYRTLTLLTVFIAYPLAALAVFAAFAALAARRRRLLPAVTALVWAAYAWYEYLMHARVLCSGECNIRVDLLLIYPVLLVLSIWTLVSVLRRKPE